MPPYPWCDAAPIMYTIIIYVSIHKPYIRSISAFPPKRAYAVCVSDSRHTATPPQTHTHRQKVSNVVVVLMPVNCGAKFQKVMRQSSWTTQDNLARCISSACFFFHTESKHTQTETLTYCIVVHTYLSLLPDGTVYVCESVGAVVGCISWQLYAVSLCELLFPPLNMIVIYVVICIWFSGSTINSGWDDATRLHIFSHMWWICTSKYFLTLPNAKCWLTLWCIVRPDLTPDAR